MSLKFSCYVFYHLKWYSFVAKLDIVLIKSSYNHRDRLVVCHTFWQKSFSFKTISINFQKTRIKDCFTFSIFDFDICLNWPTITNSEKCFFLFLNGISIVVVINSWLKQYVINLTKLVNAQ